MKLKILIISLSEIHRDPRVIRQILFLKNEYELTVIGLTSSGIEGVNYIPFPAKPANNLLIKLEEAFLATLGFFDYLYWKQKNIKTLKNTLLDLKEKPDFILSNDVQVLALASFFSKRWNADLVADLHEYAPLELENILIWKLRYKRYYYALLKKNLSNAKYVTTVCESIKNKLKTEFNINSTVLTSAPEYEELLPSKVDENKIKIIHHGGAMRSRYIHLMIDMLQFLGERFELYLMLIDTDPGYLDELKQLSLKNPRIHFLPPVPTVQIASFINQFDIGLFLLPPVNFNYRIALPNKFFEFVQARLCIAIGPSVEMASLTKQYDLGVVASDFTPRSLADQLNKLTAVQIMKYKINSESAASELSADKNRNLLLDIFKNCKQ